MRQTGTTGMAGTAGIAAMTGQAGHAVLMAEITGTGAMADMASTGEAGHASLMADTPGAADAASTVGAADIASTTEAADMASTGEADHTGEAGHASLATGTATTASTVGTAKAPQTAKTGKTATLKRMLADRHLYLMLLPFLAYYVIFYFLPYKGLQMAFMNYKPLLGYEGSKWVGWDNFARFFQGINFTRVMRNTVLLNVYGLVWAFPVPIILAILFNEIRGKFFRTMSQTISYIPNFISSVVIAGIVVNFLSPSSGIVNLLMGKFGLEPIYFMTRPEYFRTIFIAQGIWAGAGFGSIIYYSSICSISGELYEAARMDGAGRLRQILSITLPGIARTIAIMLILAVGNLLVTNTDMIILLQQPVTYETSDVIGSYVYRVGTGYKAVGGSPNYSMATAVGLFNGVVSLILVVSANMASKKIGDVGIF